MERRERAAEMWAGIPEHTTPSGKVYKWCPVHDVAALRYEKNGLTWYSHRMANGVWCDGLPMTAYELCRARFDNDPELGQLDQVLELRPGETEAERDKRLRKMAWMERGRLLELARSAGR